MNLICGRPHELAIARDSVTMQAEQNTPKSKTLMNRRTLLKYSLATGTSLLSTTLTSNAKFSFADRLQDKPAFQMDLCGGRVGIGAGQEKLIELAAKNGFSAVQPNSGTLSSLDQKGIDALNAKLKAAKLVWSAADLPVEFRKDEARFSDDLKKLSPIAKALQSAGVTRMGTWLMPCHDTLTYRANFRQHVKRLKAIGKVLEQHKIRLGLEYVGTKTLWTSKRFPFLHTMKETKELIAVIGQANIGFILDSWHWTMAGENGDDIRSLKNEQVVACDLNDAPKDIEIAEQIDNQRTLPMETAVIDTKGFFQALVDIKYDGPIRAEPFSKTLNAMDDDAAAAATGAAMKKAFDLINQK